MLHCGIWGLVHCGVWPGALWDLCNRRRYNIDQILNLQKTVHVSDWWVRCALLSIVSIWRKLIILLQDNTVFHLKEIVHANINSCGIYQMVNKELWLWNEKTKKKKKTPLALCNKNNWLFHDGPRHNFICCYIVHSFIALSGYGRSYQITICDKNYCQTNDNIEYIWIILHASYMPSFMSLHGHLFSSLWWNSWEYWIIYYGRKHYVVIDEISRPHYVIH